MFTLVAGKFVTKFLTDLICKYLPPQRSRHFTMSQVDAASTDDAKLEELKAKVRDIAEKTGKEAGVEAGIEAARNIDIEAIIAEVVGAATTAAEEQALEIKAFETMSSDIAKEAGKESGKGRRSYC